MKTQDRYANALPEGTRLDGTEKGQYEILDVLGVGGFGITYRAHDNLLQSTVAIKEYLPTDFALRDSDGSTVIPRSTQLKDQFQWGLERFLEEARTLKRFREQHIVRVESFIQGNGTAYMVMEYEEGEPLDALLKSGQPLSEAQLKQIFIPILKGLRAVHEQQFLHRDIKPGNIYLRRSGEPVLLDFGAARQALVEQSRSITGILTAGYAPFEQYSNARVLTPAADLYALGATLYRCIVGRKPVEATERIAALHNDEPDPYVPAREAGAGRYSDALLQAVDWCLQPLAKDRPQSAAQLLAVLEDSGAGMEPTVLQAAGSGDGLAGRLQEDLSRSVTQVRTGVTATAVADTGIPLSRRLGWKALFALVLAGVGAGVPLALLLFRVAPSQGEVLHLAGWALWCVLASVPLFGLAFFRRVGNPLVWRVLWGVSLVWWLADTALGFRHMIGLGSGALYQTYLFAVVGAVLLVPFFLYAFREPDQARYPGSRAPLAWVALMILVIGPVFFLQWQEARQLDQAIALYENSEFGTAYDRFVALADHDNPLAQFYLGKIYRFGIGRPVDSQAAQKWFDLATRNGAVGMIQREAQRGDAAMESNLGVMYFEGIGLEKDLTRAAQWYQRAAQQGYALGQSNYAAQLLHGLGVKQDYAAAAHWYELAAQQNYVQAQYALANMLVEGQGVPKDYAKALDWYQKAADNGYTPASVGMALLYQNGTGVDRNLSRALKLYQTAADAGNIAGERGLANLYALGQGVEKDSFKAAQWYEKAAQQGDSVSQNELGYLYGVGEGVPKDYEKALYWYRKAAQQNNATAQFNLGVMYETGTGVAQSLSDATMWYQKAAASGYPGARTALARLVKPAN